MTLNELIEANADLALWCVHVLGPDDVFAAPCHEAAVIRARQINQGTFARMRRRGEPADILCFAYAAPWPHSEESHADGLKNWLAASPQGEGSGE